MNLADMPIRILTIITFLPLVGALLVASCPTSLDPRHARSAFALATWVASLLMLIGYLPATGTRFHFVETVDWIPVFGIQYKLGIDGLSAALVVLTTTLTWICILASFGPIQTRIKEYMISFLVLEVGMIGVFLALDLFLFYIFWEVVLVPMYLIIGIWGGANRIYATIKFVLYTLVGSLLMLVAILATAFAYQAGHGVVGGRLRLRDAARLRSPAGFAPALQVGCVPGVLPGVRDQGPDVPVPHLAARRPHRGADGRLGDPRRRLLKLGAYGFLRFAVPLFPDAAADLRAGDHRAVADRDHLRRDRRACPARPQTARGVLVGQPHGLRDARASSCSPSRAPRVRSSR